MLLNRLQTQQLPRQFPAKLCRLVHPHRSTAPLFCQLNPYPRNRTNFSSQRPVEHSWESASVLHRRLCKKDQRALHATCGVIVDRTHYVDSTSISNRMRRDQRAPITLPRSFCLQATDSRAECWWQGLTAHRLHASSASIRIAAPPSWRSVCDPSDL